MDENDEPKQELERALGSLTPREARILHERLGISSGGDPLKSLSDNSTPYGRAFAKLSAKPALVWTMGTIPMMRHSEESMVRPNQSVDPHPFRSST